MDTGQQAPPTVTLPGCGCHRAVRQGSRPTWSCCVACTTTWIRARRVGQQVWVVLDVRSVCGCVLTSRSHSGETGGDIWQRQ